MILQVAWQFPWSGGLGWGQRVQDSLTRMSETSKMTGPSLYMAFHLSEG